MLILRQPRFCFVQKVWFIHRSVVLFLIWYNEGEGNSLLQKWVIKNKVKDSAPHYWKRAGIMNKLWLHTKEIYDLLGQTNNQKRKRRMREWEASFTLAPETQDWLCHLQHSETGHMIASQGEGWDICFLTSLPLSRLTSSVYHLLMGTSRVAPAC